MGSSYSGDHIAEDHINTDITTCNIEKPQHKCIYRLETVSNRLLVGGGGGGLKQVLLDPNPCP